MVLMLKFPFASVVMLKVKSLLYITTSALAIPFPATSITIPFAANETKGCKAASKIVITPLVKLADNLWIDLNIALANEIAMLSDNLGVNAQEVIDKLNKVSPTRKLSCFILNGRAIPRKGYKIIASDKVVGEVTSGTYSLGLNKGIGLGYINTKYLKESNISIKIRDNNYIINLIQPPFMKKTSLYK